MADNDHARYLARLLLTRWQAGGWCRRFHVSFLSHSPEGHYNLQHHFKSQPQNLKEHLSATQMIDLQKVPTDQPRAPIFLIIDTRVFLIDTEGVVDPNLYKKIGGVSPA
jgi:hypothetical protein